MAKTTTDHDEKVLLDDQPLEDLRYRVGSEFAVYRDGTSVKYVVTDVQEQGDRRLTYGVPR